jgi:hypothetical protein
MIGRPTATGSAPRWALSFADLCLVLLAFLLLLQAHRADPAAMGAGIRAAFGAKAPQSYDEGAAPLFQPGEAILQPAARIHYSAIGRDAAGQRGSVHIESLGSDAGARRFDAWELAAARAASIARAIQEGGLPASRIDLAIDGTRPDAAGHGQRLRVTILSR